MVARLAPTRRIRRRRRRCSSIAWNARFRRRTRYGANVRGIVQGCAHKAIHGVVGARRGGSTGIAAPFIGARTRSTRIRPNGIDAFLIECARWWWWWWWNGIALKGYAATLIDIGTASRGVAFKARFATTRCCVHDVSVGPTLDAAIACCRCRCCRCRCRGIGIVRCGVCIVVGSRRRRRRCGRCDRGVTGTRLRVGLVRGIGSTERRADSAARAAVGTVSQQQSPSRNGTFLHGLKRLIGNAAAVAIASIMIGCCGCGCVLGCWSTQCHLASDAKPPARGFGWHKGGSGRDHHQQSQPARKRTWYGCSS
jgi:hypothetical protein